MTRELTFKSDFLKYIVVLMSGTMMAQLLTYAFAPVITRLYTPVESAELGLFLRIVAVGAAIATARYEFALPITKTESHSFRLYHVALRISVIVSVISLLILFVPIGLNQYGSDLLFYGLMPVAILAMAFYNIGTNWAIRLKQFRSISFSKISNSLFGGISKILFGWAHTGYIGLILGMTIGIVLSNIWFAFDFLKANKKYSIRSNSPRNFLLAKEYNDFPKINLPHVLMDLGKDLLVAVLLLKLFSKEDFGLYDHSFRMLRLPLIFAGMAIGQVFFQRCAEKINRGEDIMPLIAKSVKILALLSVVPFVIIFFYGEEIFAFTFGENWRGAGTFSEIMAPWFMINFISSPISSLPLILRKQAQFFKLGMFAAITMILACTIPPLFFDASMITTLWIISLSQALYLVFVIFKIFEYVRKNNGELSESS